MIMSYFEWENSHLMKAAEVLLRFVILELGVHSHLSYLFATQKATEMPSVYIVPQFPAFARNKYMALRISDWSKHLEFLWSGLCVVE